MRVLPYTIFCALFCLFSCKSSKDISSMVLTSHLNGKIDSAAVSSYSDWDFEKQEGIGLLQTVKTFYNKKGYITRVEETSKNKSDSIALKITNYTYDPKHHLIEEETIYLDSVGGIKHTQIEKLINSIDNVKTWKVKDDTEVRTFENDMENITFLTDSGTVESGLTYYKKYAPTGQLLKQRLSTNHIAVINTYEYNPTSGFLFKETYDSSYRFIEQSVSDTYIYAYIDVDKLGNWKLRTRFLNDKSNPKMIYQTQKIYYRK